MSEARKAFQGKAEQKRDAELNRALAVSRQDLARMLEAQAATLEAIRDEQVSQRELLDAILAELRSGPPVFGGEEAAEFTVSLENDMTEG